MSNSSRPGGTAIAADSLVMHFGDVHALQGVSFEVPTGSVLISDTTAVASGQPSTCHKKAATPASNPPNCSAAKVAVPRASGGW